MTFYQFYQNNSGGTWSDLETVAEYVIIEAPSADAANALALNIGIYFNGVGLGLDCECCGSRWSKVREHDGYPVPANYNKPFETVPDNTIVYFEGGRVARTGDPVEAGPRPPTGWLHLLADE